MHAGDGPNFPNRLSGDLKIAVTRMLSTQHSWTLESLKTSTETSNAEHVLKKVCKEVLDVKQTSITRKLR
jgi:hypothetical protein